MTRRFGDRATFAVEVGDWWANSASLRTVDLWAGGKLLTADDNTAFLPSFLRFVRSSAETVRRREVASCPFPGRSAEDIVRALTADETGFRQRFWLLHWGETLDNVTTYAYAEADELVILFQFWRASHPFPDDLGKVFVARIAADTFASTLEESAAYMSAGTP